MNSLCTQSLLTCTPNRRCCSDDLKFDCAEEQGNAASKNAQQRAAMAGMLRPTAFWKAKTKTQITNSKQITTAITTLWTTRQPEESTQLTARSLGLCLTSLIAAQ
jgi:hypothetical protein